MSKINIGRARTDFEYFCDHLVTVDGKPLRLTPVQREFIRRTERMSEADVRVVFHGKQEGG